MNAQSMPAVIVREGAKKGEWNDLSLEMVEIPALEEGEALVQVEACSVNRADLLQRRGLYPPPPGASQVLGLDFAGFVVKRPPSSALKESDRVFGIVAGGGYGRYVAVSANHLVPIPENLSFTEAAAAAEVFFTAYLQSLCTGRNQSRRRTSSSRRGQRGWDCRHSALLINRGNGYHHRRLGRQSETGARFRGFRRD